jgi:ABC-type uncharacterized transport system substrate-binding protein
MVLGVSTSSSFTGGKTQSTHERPIMRRTRSLTAMLCTLAFAMSGAPNGARAHPHVYVTAKAEVVYDKGQIAAVANHWTFDEFYTAMAIQGLDANNDGTYSREELAELAKVNMEGLKEFDYFTFAKLGAGPVAFAPPAEPWLEHVNGVLTLHFRLPLKEPVPAETMGFALSVYDPSYFIAFELAKGEAVTLAGAPAGCKVTVADTEEKGDNKSLSGAFSQQLGGMGSGTTKSAAVTCSKS